MVEKFLKAILLSNGWTLQRIHTLNNLFNEALPYEPTFAQYHLVCQKISTFYMLDRYPTTTPSGTIEQIVRDCLRDIQGLIKQIRAALRTS